jgi:hypothetical protein
MATYRYATKDLSIQAAEAFVAAASMISGTASDKDGRNTKNSSILYVCLGREEDWPNEPTPIQPPDNEQHLHYELHRKFIGGKKVTAGDISHVTVRHDWTSGTVYAMYRDIDTDMYDRAFYVMTDENNVYKCLYNNKSAASTVQPTGFSTLPFTTSDGYTWKYMYTIPLGDAQKFMTPLHIPVKTIQSSDGSVESARQLAVQNAAVNGAIHVIETVQTGSGYHYYANGVVESAGTNTLRLSTAVDSLPSPIDNFYNGSSVYIISGTGAGQLRRIIDYSGTTKTLTVNTAFQTIANTDSRVIISPTVTVIGDGMGAKAYSIVDTSIGSIANIAVISVGSNYTRAQALISSNSIHGAGATANVVISPLGGHGHDPIRELYADKVMLNVQFNGSEGVSATGRGYIPSNTDFRTISLLRDPVLKVNANNEPTTVEYIANTSNSPATLRFCNRLTISYNQMNGAVPVNALTVGDIITNERNRLRAETGELEFVTALGPAARAAAALANAVKAANANIVYLREDETQSDPSFYTVYINNVESYSDYAAFTKDDVILKSTSETKIATVEALAGPEANTFSGEVLFTENLQAVTRDPDQIEDIKIILDF